MHYAVTGTTGRSSARVIAIEEPTGASCLEHENHPGRRLGAMRTGLTIGPPEDIAMTIEVLGAAELCNVYDLQRITGGLLTEMALVMPRTGRRALHIALHGAGTRRPFGE